MNLSPAANYSDTIAAVATPPGKGGVGIVRVSGRQAADIGRAMLDELPKPRYAQYGNFYDAEKQIIDQGIALYFQAPHSFTGEDVVELQAHGGPVVLDLLLKRVMQLGARLARPGEFSERAFLNNKMDLAQAEAVADLINAQSQQAAQSAMRSLQGEFSKRIQQLVEALIQLRIFVEAAIDFPEEEIDFLSDGKVAQQLQAILQQLENVLANARQGQLLREGINVVIAGKPNAGKSSLLNQLSGQASAIVTAIPGTTRDVLREYIQIDGMPLHIIDTAGLRASDDPVEQEGIKRAEQEIQKADRILLMIDAKNKKPLAEELLALPAPLSNNKTRLTVVYNKIDITTQLEKFCQQDGVPTLYLSAKTGVGIELLRQHLKDCMGFQAAAEGIFTARRRHLDALTIAKEHLLAGQQQLLQYKAGELLAEELLQAQQALTEITGEFHADDLLGRIFADFCIGK